MPKPSVHEILSAPITLVRPSTDKEKELFADKHKKEGCFYTLGLASGQKFVAHLGEDRFENVFTLRPLKNLLPNLREIQWVKYKVFGGPGVTVNCLFFKQTSQTQEWEYKETLRSCPKMVQINGFYAYTKPAWAHHPIFNKLTEIAHAYDTCKQCQEALFEAQKNLKSLEISKEEKSDKKANQLLQQKQPGTNRL